MLRTYLKNPLIYSKVKITNNEDGIIVFSTSRNKSLVYKLIKKKLYLLMYDTISTYILILDGVDINTFNTQNDSKQMLKIRKTLTVCEVRYIQMDIDEIKEILKYKKII